MKKTILFLCAVALIQGCKKEEVNVNSISSNVPTTLNTRSVALTLDENSIGEFHNQMLDNYYDELKSKMNQVGNALQKSHFRNVAKTVLNNTYSHSQNGKIKNFAMDVYDNRIELNSTEDNIQLSIDEINASTYGSPALKSFLISVITQGQTKLDIIAVECFCTERKDCANGCLSGDELKIAIAAVNVYKSSYDYWGLNYNKWRDLINPDDNDDMTPSQRASVAGADAAGFSTGAFWGAAGGTAFLPGVGTVTGAYAVGLAGAAWASATAAIGNFWDYWFG